MVLKGWMVLALGAILGILAAYLSFVFVTWDWGFFLPAKASADSRMIYLLVSGMAGCFGSIPFIRWSVDIDMQNKRKKP